MIPTSIKVIAPKSIKFDPILTTLKSYISKNTQANVNSLQILTSVPSPTVSDFIIAKVDTVATVSDFISRDTLGHSIVIKKC
jgi:hypothetical protein